MTATVPTPDSPLDTLEPWIAARMLAADSFDPATFRLRGATPRAAGPEAERDLRPAAVLAALVERRSGLTMLLTRRADSLARHSGQISLPGGRAEPDETPYEAALRETEEEIGLDRSFVRVLGCGDPYETTTGYRVVPVVAIVRPGFTLTPCVAEVAEVFETPFAFVMNPLNHEQRVQDTADGRRRHYYAMPYEDRLIWGVTAGILRLLYERVFGDEAAVAMGQSDLSRRSLPRAAGDR